MKCTTVRLKLAGYLDDVVERFAPANAMKCGRIDGCGAPQELQIPQIGGVAFLSPATPPSDLACASK
jgi:hypothetical protein